MPALQYLYARIANTYYYHPIYASAYVSLNSDCYPRKAGIDFMHQLRVRLGDADAPALQSFLVGLGERGAFTRVLLLGHFRCGFQAVVPTVPLPRKSCAL